MNTQENTLMERTPFQLPDLEAEGGDAGFTREELAEDIDGLQLGFKRVKIPSGGQVQFEVPGDDPDNPDYTKFLEGIIVYSHNSNAYWSVGKGEDENTPPDCQSMDGKLGYGCPGGICADCPNNRFGSDPKGSKGKACKNMRVLYLLRSGDLMPIQLTLSPTSLRPYTEFVNAAFVARRRGVCGSLVRIGLKKANNGKDDYSVATFRRLYDFTGEELAKIRAYANGFKEQVKLLLGQRAESIEAEAGSGVEIERPVRVMPNNEDHFEVGTAIDGGRNELPQ